MKRICIKTLKDTPFYPCRCQSTLGNKTGNLEVSQAFLHHSEGLAVKPARSSRIISFLSHLPADGKPRKPGKILESNPFPSTCGRVATSVQRAATRKIRRTPGHQLPGRFLGIGMKDRPKDGHRSKKERRTVWSSVRTGGLSWRLFLAAGYGVTVLKPRKTGGMLRYGSQDLPLNREIERIESLG